MSEKDEFVRFFQKYGVSHDVHGDPRGIMVGQSVFEFDHERFTGVRWDELGRVDKRIETLEESLADELIDSAVWVANETGLVFSFQEEPWNQIPVSIQDRVNEIVRQAAEDVFQILTHDGGFNPEQWVNELAVDTMLRSMEQAFEEAIKRAESRRSFGHRTAREFMKMTVKENMVKEGLILGE
jgi:hypothetical protein